MTIVGTFESPDGVTFVKIDGNNILFMDDRGTATTLEGLRFDKTGVLKEFPDLKDDEDWRKKSMDRLKEHIKTFESEKDKMEYVREELTKFGNKALYYVQNGFRPKSF
jgi:hypothetical protein